MMKIIGQTVALLLLLLVAALITIVTLLQTTWGVRQANQLINRYSTTLISFSGIKFYGSSPDKITLGQVTLRLPQQTPFLKAQAVDIQLSLRQLFSPGNVARITLHDGHLDLGGAKGVNALRADSLQLANMAVSMPALNAQASTVNATLAPWRPQPEYPLGRQAAWQANFGQLTVDGQTASDVVVQGKISTEEVDATLIQAHVWGGNLSGAFQRLATGQWHIQDLRLEKLRLQTTDSLPALWRRIAKNQGITVERLSVNDARLEGSNWAMTDLNFTLSDVSLKGDHWQSEQGQLHFQANEAIIGDFYLLNPEIAAHLVPQGITFTDVSSQWQKGTVKASGQWQRVNGALIVDQLAAENLEYTLPAGWKTWLNRPLPAWLDRVTVRQWRASRNLIIDIDPEFPWQITALGGEAHNIQLVKDKNWGVWQGNGDFNAQAATFNQTDVVRPALGFHADANAIAVTKLNGLVDNGKLGATATISQDALRQTRLTLRGEGITANALHHWGWPAIDMTGPVNMALQAEGNLSAGQPLRPGVNATLTLTGNEEERHQVMKKGALIP